jgi:amidase
LTHSIIHLSAVDLSRAIANRTVSCREVMAAYLDRIDAVNPAVNAIVALQSREALMAQADQSDALLARGERKGWMHGFPVAVKDLAPTAGIKTTLGSPIFRDFIPSVDGLVVSRMKAAGAIVIGKTNTPEFGLGSHTFNPVYGLTRNPYDPSRSAGGSSGGAAAALALRMLPVADGSDMGGSLRNPAGWNNVFGMRPSLGRVPKWPELDGFFQQLGVEGPMARSAADLAQLLAIQAGRDPRAPLSLDDDPRVFAGSLGSDTKGIRVGWLGDFEGHLAYEEGVVETCEEALGILADIGCIVESARVPFDMERLWLAWLTLRSVNTGANLIAHSADPAKRQLLKPEALWEIEQAERTTALDLHRASITRTDWYRVLLECFEQYDFLALPSAQLFPFPAQAHWPSAIAGRTMDTYHRWMEVMIPATMAGCPAISVPAGFGGAIGLPIGLQLIGRPQADLALLRLAHAFDLASDWVRRAPPPEPEARV